MNRSLLVLSAVSAFLGTAVPAHAYIGPGGGLSALGALVALVAAVVLAFLGFLWYPIKRLLRKRRRRAEGKREQGDSSS